MKDIPVGSYVTIRNTSEYYGEDPNSNPAGQKGVVLSIRGGSLGHRVMWLHSESTNAYDREDLRYWRSEDGKPQPKKEKKQKAKSKPLPELLKEAEAECRKKGVSTVARYAFIYDNTFEVNTNTACHAQVLNYNVRKHSPAPNYIYTYFHNCIDTRRLGAVEAEAYGKWLVEESPWKDAFVNKDVYKPDSFLLCTTEIHGAVLQGALVATRQVYEHPERVALWYSMYSSGVDGRTAFYLASVFRLDGNNVAIGLHPGGHYPIDAYDTSLDKFLNFTTDWSAVTFKESKTSCGCHRLFTDGGRDVDWIKSRLNRLLNEVKGGKKKTNKNPFKKAKKGDDNNVADFGSLVAYVKENGV